MANNRLAYCLLCPLSLSPPPDAQEERERGMLPERSTVSSLSRDNGVDESKLCQLDNG